MHYSEPEEVSNSTTGEATGSSTAMFPALCGRSNAVLTEKVNTAITHRGRVGADEAAASPIIAAAASPIIIRTSQARDQMSHVKQGEASPGMSPRETQVRAPENHSLSSRPITPSTPQEPRYGWAPINTDSWEEYEEAARRATQRIVQKAMNCTTNTMDLLRMDVNEQIKRQVEGLRTAGDSEEFQQPEEIRDLMGRTRYLCERREDSNTEIAMLEAQRQELEAQRAQGVSE